MPISVTWIKHICKEICQKEGVCVCVCACVCLHTVQTNLHLNPPQSGQPQACMGWQQKIPMLLLQVSQHCYTTKTIFCMKKCNLRRAWASPALSESINIRIIMYIDVTYMMPPSLFLICHQICFSLVHIFVAMCREHTRGIYTHTRPYSNEQDNSWNLYLWCRSTVQGIIQHCN